MTTEDAIYVIGQIGQWMSPKEAFTMAIDALEKQKEQGPVHEDDSKPQTDAEILTHYLWWAESDEEECPYTWKRFAKAIKAGIDALNQTLPEADTKAFNDGVKEGRRLEREDIQKEQKPAEWSEEDKLKLDNLVGLVEEIKRQPLKRLEDWDGYINFLKSLPERFNLQPKQEWSEEDIEIIDKICSNLEYLIQTVGCDSVSKEKLEERIKWMMRLKSLRLQPHWKPSEEQMKALKHCVDGWQDCADGVLESLYKELKKL